MIQMDDYKDILEQARQIGKDTLKAIAGITSETEASYYEGVGQQKAGIVFHRLNYKIMQTTNIIKLCGDALQKLDSLSVDMMEVIGADFPDVDYTVAMDEMCEIQIKLLKHMRFYNDDLNSCMQDLEIRLEPSQSIPQFGSSIHPFIEFD